MWLLPHTHILALALAAGGAEAQAATPSAADELIDATCLLAGRVPSLLRQFVAF